MSKDNRELTQVVSIDEGRIRDHLGELVRGTVEETLNAMLDAEADALCGAGCYQRSPDRVDSRAGTYNRKLHTHAGEVGLKMPKLRRQTFLARFHKLLGPTVIDIGVNAFSTAQLGNIVFTTKTFFDNPDLFFCGILPAGGPANIPNRFLCTSFLAHHRFLIKVNDELKLSLSKSG